MALRARITAVLFAATAVAPVWPLAAQTAIDTAALQKRLPTLTGRERVRALGNLCEAYRSSDPERAVDLCKQTLSLAEAYPDADSEVRAYNEGGWALMELGRYDEAMAQAKEGEALAKRSSLRKGEARALNNQGVIQRRRGGFGDALELFRRAQSIYEDIGDETSVAIELNNLSVVMGFDLGDFDRALESQLRALEIRERLGNTTALYQSYNNLGVIYDNLGKYDDAVRYLNQALDGWRKLDVKPRIAATLSNLGEVYTKTGALDRALGLQRESLALRRELSSRSGVTVSLNNIGTILTEMDSLPAARATLDSAVALGRKLGERKNTAQGLLGLAGLDRRVGRYKDGEARVAEALSIASEISAKDTERGAYKELASLREAAGDAEGALKAFREWNRRDKDLFDEASTRRVEALRAEYEADRQQREIDRLTAEAALASSTAQRRGTLLVVALLAAVVVFLLYRRRVMRQLQRRLEHEVEERTTELSDANARLEELSLTDTLTGLKNRRYVFQTIAADVALSVRAHEDANREGTEADGANLVFYVMDLDDFKSVNDEFGHATGDMVLEQMARLLEETARASDIVVRWGGEEFLVLSRRADRRGAPAFAERLRQSVRNHGFACDDGRVVRRTCSVGFAAFPFVPAHPDGTAWEVVLGLADQASYLAKRAGRDAWVGLVASPTTDAAVLSAAGTVVHDLVDAGHLKLVTSFGSEATARMWDDREADADSVARL